MRNPVDYTLYLVTDQDLMSTQTLEQAVEQACEGGVTLVQIREKKASQDEFLDVARRCKAITDRFGVGLIVNDNPHVAAQIGALGVHVGQDDTPVPQVRQIVGPDAIIGVSAHTVEEAQRAQAEGADYLGIGGITLTATKPDAPALTFAQLDAIVESVDIPCVVIGGVNARTIPLCHGHGFAGYAVVSAIIAQPDIAAAAAGLRRVIARNDLPSADAALRDQILTCVETVKATNPMAPSITNFVTIDYVANAQLAVGGSAAMVYLPDEGEMLAGSPSMYLNMGTLMPVYGETIPRTGRALAAAGTPWVLDPVGIGIGSLRTQLLQSLRDCRPGIIRCNASEAIALASLWGLTQAEDSGVRGVDSTDSVDSAQAAAVALARHTGGAVAVSGEVDLVTDGFRVARVKGGSPLLTCITGSGCSLGGVAAIYATAADPFAAALTATVAYNLAADRAAQTAQAPGSFKVAFLDALYLNTAEQISAYPFEVEVLA
ncbi:MAG: thiamine phosphate synthase [Eggerthellales bacterium]|nr:thiamine phosphate synthase [Eggerthellales bacterium]